MANINDKPNLCENCGHRKKSAKGKLCKSSLWWRKKWEKEG